MKALAALIVAAMVPLILLNTLGGIIAVIWLAILGEWSAIFLGFAIMIGGASTALILLAPGTVLAGMGVVALERGRKFAGWSLIVLSSPWTYVVVIAWEVVVFKVFGRLVTDENLIPMWLWSYGVATGVWSYLARKEQESGGGGIQAIAAFSAQMAYIVLAICQIWLNWALIPTITAMAVVQLFPLMIGLFTVFTITASSRREA